MCISGYRLMLIDTASLSFDTIELGDDVPRYALSPDGQLLLVDSPSFWRDGRIRILEGSLGDSGAVGHG